MTQSSTFSSHWFIHLIHGGHDENTATASCKLAVVIRVISMYRYPRCDSSLNAPEAKPPCLVGLLNVWTCAAPFSEGVNWVPYKFRVSRSPSIIWGMARPSLRVGQLRTTKLKGEIPMLRANPSCLTELTGKISVRRLNHSCTAGLKGAIPIRLRKLNQSCTAGLKGVIPRRRVNQSCTAEWEREYEEPTLSGLHSRPEIRCSERDLLRRTMMPLDAPGIGERRGRTRCAEIGIFRSPRGPWLWHDRRDWNCVVAFIPPWHDCRDLNFVIAVTF